MSPRVGRPIKGDSKRDMRLQVRISEEELKLIDYCANRMSKTKTEVVVEGIQLVKEKLDAEKK